MDQHRQQLTPTPPVPPTPRQGTHTYARGHPVARAVDRSAERLLSALAHGAIAFGFLGIGFLVSLLISAIIWLYSRRSPQVRFHSEQAGCYQCSVLLVNIAAVIVLLSSGGFAIANLLQGRSDWAAGLSTGFFIVLGLFLIWYVTTIIYGIVAAVLVLLGRPFKYPIIGDRVGRSERPTNRPASSV